MVFTIGVVGQRRGLRRLDEAFERCTRGGESPVVDNQDSLAESRVARGTRNPV
jgi:hypothetical protein